MRKVAAVLLACLAVAGCASDWQEQVTYEVVEVYDYKMAPSSEPEKRVRLKLSGDAPSGVLSKDSLASQAVALSDIGGGDVAAGDTVTCTAKQHSSGAVQTNEIKTELSGCRRA
ncbi:hypothetical protein SAMN05216553_102237 [Lentzea fradiae]|uniref:Lipoprotein n=1 Tax=Lentzea fradiae TaxID=200378 RepID=A0A1G7MDB8_9PSEU|nr:hypothetical protein [Lentzea fradiae]SDF59782.1 hypothetical protein SAMN05216553_102237 [Lentzea fradiae]